MPRIRVRRSPLRNAILVTAAVIACGDPRVTAPVGLDLIENPQVARAVVCEVSWAAPTSGLWNDATKWDPQVVPTTNDDVCITVDGNYTVEVRGAQVANTVTIGHPDNAGTQTLLIQAFNITSSLTAAAGMTNDGTITLAWNRGTNGHAAVLASTAGTVVNSGLIQTVTDAVSAPRVIAANLLNLGTVSIGHITTFDKQDAVYENRGTFTVPNFRDLHMTGKGQIFRQSEGTLTVGGSFGIANATLEFNGGNIVGGGIVITSGTLAIGEGSEGAGGFTVRGASTLSGNIAAAQHILIEAFNATSTLTSATAFTNAGRIDMRWNRSQNGHAAVLAVTDGILTNSGTIETFSDPVSAPRVIAASLLNTGSVIIGAATTFNKANAVYENRGTFNISQFRSVNLSTGAGQVFRQVEGTLTVAGSMVLNGQTFEVAGGTITGRPIINDGMLRFVDGCTGSGDFSVRGANAKLDGDIPADYTVRINTNGAVTSVLTSAEGFTNAGTIEMLPGGSGSNNGTATNIAVTTGALTNTGLIRVMSDAFGGTGRLFLATVVNRPGGTIDIRTRLTRFQKADGAHVNEGEILLNNNTFTISGLNQSFTTSGFINGQGTSGSLALTGITLRASGIIAAHMNLTNVTTHIGDGVSGVTVQGNYRMITGGSLNIDLHATPNEGNDLVNITGSATLLGTLNVAAFDGVCIDPNLSFEFMRFASRAGDFGVKNGLNLGGGRTLTAVPTATSYRLNSAGPLCVPPDESAPVIAPTIVGTLGSNGWYVSDVSVSWSVTDAESPVTSQVGCEDASVTADNAGVTFTCSATSAGGSTSQSVTIKRDATPPAVSAERVTAANEHGWNNTDVVVKYTRADAMSGPSAAMEFEALSQEGANQTASRTYSDNAGNSATASVTGINIDKTAPTGGVTRTPEANANGWNNTNVNATFTGSDALSGIDGVTSSNRGFTADAANMSALHVFTDRAGNSTTIHLTGVSIDRTAPVASASRAPLANAFGWNNGDVTATYSATDALSGIDGSPSATQLFSLEGANQGGSRTFTDLAGNSATASIGDISIDKTAPVVTVTRAPLPDANGWNSTSVTATWNATDALSGIDGAATFQQVFDQDGANQGGSHTFSDRAGNSASATIGGINIDRTPLAASCSVTPSEIWPANNKMVAARVTIGGTGIESYRLRSVSNNETGTADVEGWSVGTADLDGFVRASRNGSGSGRTYSLTYDVFGRSAATSCTVTIRIAHDQRGR